jgi:hypothetical protein
MTDHIWNQYLGTNFVTAKEKIIEDLKTINQQTAFLDQNNKNQDLEKISEQLSSTLESLRDITIKQTCLANHAKFQEKLTKEIDLRSLGKFYTIEETLLNTRDISKESKNQFLEIISLRNLKINDIDIHKNDILRLSIIYYLINQSILPEEIKEIEKYLSNSGISLQALNYFKEKRSFEESMRKGGGNNDTDRSFLQKSISYFVKKITTSGQASIIAETVNNLASNKEVKEYNTYNLIKKVMDKVNTNFNQVIVFVIGGGSLAEFEYLEESLIKNDRTVNN